MSSVFFLLEWLATPLYIVLAVAIVWFGYRGLRAQADLRSTYFQLERDMAKRRSWNALTMIVLAIEIIVLLVGVQVRAVPFLEAERSLDEAREVAIVPTDIPFETDTPSAALQGGLDIEPGTPLGQDTGIGFVPTPTLTPTPVGTILPNPPSREGCLDDDTLMALNSSTISGGVAHLEVPANGMRVFQPIIVRGLAYADDFTGAKIEIRGPSTNQEYAVIESILSPVQSISDFSQFIPAGNEEGLYQFRLTVFGSGGVLVASCMVNIYITEPPVTATPTPPPGADAEGNG